jgi:lipid-binding SYLF domain-containing protein
MVAGTVVVLCLLSACSTSQSLVQSRNEKQRASIRRVAETALSELYRAKPSARIAVESSAGYAVFSDYGFRFIFMGDARAMGVAVNNMTKQETFMKMVELHPTSSTNGGKFRLVLVFETEDVLRTFTKSAWFLGPNVMAAAFPDDKVGPFSGAMALMPGMHVYQLDQSGVLAGFSVRDVMFYKDRELQ